MDSTEHLKALGEEALYIEMLYLNLKIEKALMGVRFRKQRLLCEAEKLWRDINTEYYSFLSYLQQKSKRAA